MSWHRHSSECDCEIRSAALRARTVGMCRPADHNPWRQFPGQPEPPASCRGRTDRIGGWGERLANEIARACEPGCPATAWIAHSPIEVRPPVDLRCSEGSENHGYAH